MSKVVVFYGSPRKKGYTKQLLDQVVAGAESAGAEIVTYDLNEDGVKGCQGCMYCRAHSGTCATKDKLQPMYDDIKEATGIAASFPIYFGDITGQGKLWVDRLYPFMGADFKPTNPGKKVVTAYAQGNPDVDSCKAAMESTNGVFGAFGWQLVDCLLSFGNGMPGYEIPQETMDQAFAAGRALAS